MKTRFPILLFFALILLGCSQEPETPQSPVEPMATPEFSKSRSVTEAIGIALSSANSVRSQASSRGINSPLSVTDVKIIKGTQSRSGISDSLLYVVNFADEQGFVLVSAPRIKEDVLAIVDEGNFNPEEECDNPGFNYYLACATDYVQNKVDTQQFDGIEIKPVEPPLQIFKSQLDTIYEYNNYHHVAEQLKWGQSNIYGRYCPNGYAGCVPTACAIIATFMNDKYNNNFTAYYTFPERKTTSELLNWAEIKKHKRYTTIFNVDCSEKDPASIHKTIGHFMRQLGLEMNSTYYTDGRGTGTYAKDVRATLVKYLPSNIIVSDKPKTFDSPYLTTTIDGGLLLMFGSRTDPETGKISGHAFVADGYYKLKTHYQYWERDVNTMQWHKKTDEYYLKSLTRFNWGWDGNHNGYYEGNVLNVPNGNVYKDLEYMSVTWR